MYIYISPQNKNKCILKRDHSKRKICLNQPSKCSGDMFSVWVLLVFSRQFVSTYSTSTGWFVWRFLKFMGAIFQGNQHQIYGLVVVHFYPLVPSKRQQNKNNRTIKTRCPFCWCYVVFEADLLRNFNVLSKLTFEQKYMETMHSSLQGWTGGYRWKDWRVPTQGSLISWRSWKFLIVGDIYPPWS